MVSIAKVFEKMKLGQFFLFIISLKFMSTHCKFSVLILNDSETVLELLLLTLTEVRTIFRVFKVSFLIIFSSRFNGIVFNSKFPDAVDSFDKC